ncbi:helix-turn-helix domain-containing protein [Minwuia sp. IMCC3077]|uniref:helix-turn-helix domain-containing protein n=1 Tax=Minwuia sp. IMCC3077 TaxID=3040676 RepID=UPI002479029C|nr:helix-turn-helix domain-containing protein [Minwuia sp. IMCC3077]
MPDSGRQIADDRSLREGRLNLYEVEAAESGGDGVYRGVGAELKAERDRFGLLLSEVSDRLRIRVAYLEAIEEGRFGDLPGRIYAIGFLRSYAEFLGADGDVCVQMFKDEAGTGGHSRRLEFPVPQNENRRPGKATLLVAVLLGAAVYGGWFVLQGKDQQTVDIVPEVPESIARQVQTVTATPTTAAPEQAATTAQAVAGQSRDTNDGNSVSEENSGSLMAANAADARTESAPVGTADAAAPARDITVAEPPVTETEPATVPRSEASAPLTDVDTAPLNRSIASEPVGQAQEDGTQAVAETAPAVENTATSEPVVPQIAALGPPPLPPTAPRAESVPRVFGVANTDARIIIRATDRAQIFVKQAGGRTVLPHRVLQAGDEYRAPDLDGLLIRSDNVNGLELIVDGRNLGPVGRLSDAQNNLALDPDWLLKNAGTR